MTAQPQPEERPGLGTSPADVGGTRSEDAFQPDPDRWLTEIRRAVVGRETSGLERLRSLASNPEQFRPEHRTWLPAALASALDLAELAIGADGGPSPTDGDRDLKIATLRGAQLKDADSVTVPVLFGQGMRGSVGTIRLRLLESGPVGLYQDPEGMFLRNCDRAFLGAIHTAWELRGLADACVLWSVENEGSLQFQGDSVGVQFALALDQLKRRRRRFGRLRALLRGPRYTWVATAGLAPDGQLTSVAEIPQKLEAAAATRKRVILASVDRREGDTSSARERVKVDYADTLNQASRIARRLHPVYVSSLVGTVILASALGGGGYWINSASEHRAHVRDLLGKAQQLQALANETGTRTVPDLQTRSLLLLAARSLAQDAGRSDIANQMVDDVPASAAGIVGTVHQDLGFITGMHNVFGNVLVSSDKGALALYNPANTDLLGQYTEPPGLEALDQPQMKALALNPHVRILAAVYQVGIGVAGVSTAARVRIFSAAQGLRLIGSSTAFTNKQVLAMGYSSGGAVLITATQDEVTFWDTTHAVPTSLGRCTLPGEQRPFIGVYDDPVTHHPDLVENDTSVLSLASWQAPSASTACALGGKTAPWAADVADSAFDAPAVTLGSAADKTIVVAALTKTGQVKVHATDGASGVLAPTGGASAIGEPGDGIAVESHVNGQPTLTLWNLSTPSTPELEATYPKLTLPAVDDGVGGFATESNNVVHRIDTQSTRYPAGFIVLGPAHREVDAVAGGGRDVALAYGQLGIAVYSLSGARQARFVTFPDNRALAPGDGRQSAVIAMSDDDRYLAAIVAPVRGSGSSSPKPRQLLIWDASMGTPLAVAAPFADQLATRAAPLAVRFLPGTDTLLVNTFSGTLYRMGPQGTQERSELLRQAPAGAHTVALETGVGGIYLLESDPAANATRSDRVVLLDPDGSMRRSWDVTSLKISIGQIAALSDGGALLVDNAGRAYRLGTDGRVGAAVDLNAGVVTDAHQLPGTQIVMLAVQRSSVISSTEEYDLSKDVVVRTGGPGVPLFSFATTKDGAYLAGSDLLDVRGVLAALRPQDKAANLCAVAGRELTQQEWDAYVGSVAPYRKLCMDADGGLAPFYDAGRQGLYLSTPQIARTPSASEAASYANACAAPQSDGYTTSGPFSWRAGTDSTAICVNGAPEWVVHPTPRLQIKPATIGGQSVLVVSGQTFGNPGTGASQMSTAFDVLSPTAVDISSSASATAAITTDATGVTLTAAQGDIEVATTYGVDQNGDWTLLSQTPVGAALTVTSAKK